MVTNEGTGLSSPVSAGDNEATFFGFEGVTTPSIHQVTPLRRHDSTFSAATDYDYSSGNDLSFWQGAALLTADCLGTGILALPQGMKVLGWRFGLSFLILNVPINLYAGTILSSAADYVERKQTAENEEYRSLSQMGSNAFNEEAEERDDAVTDTKSALNSSIRAYDTIDDANEGTALTQDSEDAEDDLLDPRAFSLHRSLHHDTATFDFIGMTSALFRKPIYTTTVMFLFYLNIFLVLGDYILVMSHAVAALLGESWICIPQAGIIASTLMFAVSQLRTMANLGRTASLVSLAALFIVLLQCIYYARHGMQTAILTSKEEASTSTDELPTSLLRKLSAMGSIGFAMGSQKLFLNIRHELADRRKAPRSLAVSLLVFASCYILVVVLSGPDPPSLLFDTIPTGFSRRIAGLFMWIHVVVSYAINSQAICGSMDRIFFHKWRPVKGLEEYQRWIILTSTTALSAFFISNAIPFFKDLVALIGGLTSIPLTLLFPAILHRKVMKAPIWIPTKSTVASYSLLIFSLLFTIATLTGSLSSIMLDWKEHVGGFFSCNG